ncbi:MAG TPA: aminotransferase class I/II-fold pyridoxal phosphate-dependent enzyme [Acidimicrobiales bacterium]|jgi:succinyldiaminopimelate transaminase|nr:aminotransferase class I/II-fold pyridoxal phosphate-dependent enzyme [Acidimicrobiales bacterium]
MSAAPAAATVAFRPPAYPYDRLIPARSKAGALAGGVVDLSVGTPTDPPPDAVMRALSGADEAGVVRGYPASVGSDALLAAIVAWTGRRLGARIGPESVGACVGTKEFVATLPQWLKLRTPGRDTVLYPAVAYPTYHMGAVLAGLRAVPVPVDPAFGADLSAVSDSDAARALVLWVNSPGNPAGQLDDLAAAAAWGRDRGVLVASDECYAEFTWDGEPRTVLGAGTGTGGLGGVLALHSLSKRSNLAGLRLGWYAGDTDLVAYLREVRKHAGMMVPGPVQLAGVAALADQTHVEQQRSRYRERLVRMREIFAGLGVEVALPLGGFYLWAPAPGADAWAFTERLASQGGVLVSPGEFYGPPASGYVRAAAVAPLERLDLVRRRLGM